MGLNRLNSVDELSANLICCVVVLKCLLIEMVLTFLA